MPLDNVIPYTLSDDEAKHRKALKLLAAGCVISTQVLGEVANVMRRKFGIEMSAIRAVICRLIDDARLHPVAASTILYSEDLQHGQTLDRGLTVIDPFLVGAASP